MGRQSKKCEKFSFKRAFGVTDGGAQNALYGQPVLHINCNGFFEVENCRGIIQYDINHLKLDMGRQAVTIEGEGIQVDTFQKADHCQGNIVFALLFGKGEMKHA